MAVIKMVIFDCDGVLVDSEPISSRVLAEELRGLGVSISDQSALEIFKGGKLQDAFLHAEQVTGRPVPKNIESVFREKCKQAFEAELEPIPGVHDLLSNYNFPRCVASNGPKEKIALNLRLTNLSSFFSDDIFSAYDIQKWKPDPSLFLWAAKNMNIDAKDCIVVEDSLHGVIAARQAGMRVYAYAPSANGAELANAGAKVFEDMKELPALIF